MTLIRLAAAAFLVALAAPAAAQQLRTTGLTPAQTDSVLAVSRAIDERWGARDAAGLTAAYTADAHTRILGTTVDLRGSKEILAYFRQSFAAGQGVLRHRTIVQELQQIAPGIVATDGEVFLDRRLDDGTFVPYLHFTTNAVAVRTAEGWRIRINRVRPDAAPPRS